MRLPFGVTNGVSCFQRIVGNVIEKYKLSGLYAYVDNTTVCGYDKNDHDNKLNARQRNAELLMNRNVFLLVLKLICLVTEFLVKKLNLTQNVSSLCLDYLLTKTKSDLLRA